MSRDGAVSTITVIGEVLVDLAIGQDWSCRATPGGAPANVAVGLARLGQHVSLRARLSGDGLGLMLREHLVASGGRLRRRAGTGGATAPAGAPGQGKR